MDFSVSGSLSLSSVHFSSHSCPTLCDPMDCSTPGFPVRHQLPELAQTHVHLISDAIQLSHSPVVPFSSCLQSFPAAGSFIMSHFFALGVRNIGVTASASVLISFRMDWLNLFAVQGIFSRVFSNTAVQKNQFFSTQLSLSLSFTIFQSLPKFMFTVMVTQPFHPLPPSSFALIFPSIRVFFNELIVHIR